MIKGVTLNLNAGTVKIKNISQVLNEMNRIEVFADEEYFVRQQMMPRQNLMAASYTYDERGNERVSYLDKMPSIQKPRDFKEMKKNFSEYLLTTKELVFADSNADEYMTIGDNVIKVKLENLLQGIEDAVAKLDNGYMTSSNSLGLFPLKLSLVLFLLKPRTWCLFVVDVWSMVYAVKAVEGSLFGISPLPHKAKSWIIIEVERTPVSSNLSPNVRKSYD
jgi:hypothetical protein